MGSYSFIWSIDKDSPLEPSTRLGEEVNEHVEDLEKVLDTGVTTWKKKLRILSTRNRIQIEKRSRHDQVLRGRTRS